LARATKLSFIFLHLTCHNVENYDGLNVKNKTKFCSTFYASWQESI